MDIVVRAVIVAFGIALLLVAKAFTEEDPEGGRVFGVYVLATFAALSGIALIVLGITQEFL